MRDLLLSIELIDKDSPEVGKNGNGIRLGRVEVQQRGVVGDVVDCLVNDIHFFIAAAEGT